MWLKEKYVRSVDDVLEVFYETVADLEDVATRHTVKAEEHKEMMNKHAILSAEAKTEAARAANIAEKMKEIFK